MVCQRTRAEQRSDDGLLGEVVFPVPVCLWCTICLENGQSLAKGFA